MKKNKQALILGAILFAAGCVLFAASFLGLFLDVDTTPMTNARRLTLAENAEKTAATTRPLLMNRIAELRNYYEKQTAANPALADAYAERLEQLRLLEEALSDGGSVDESTYRQWRRMQSVDGVDTEVVALNYLQSQLGTLHDNENAAAQYRAEIAAHPEAEIVPKAPADASSAFPVPVIGLLLGAVMIGVGLWLNHGYRLKQVTGQVFLYLLLIVGAVIMVFPFYWMISSSFKSRIEVSMFPPLFIPGNLTNLDNYRVAFKQAPFATYFVNSVVVCVLSVAVVTFTTVLAAFAFSRLKFPGREVVFSALLSMMMLPFEMLVITNYSTIIRLNLNDTLAALVAPFISSIFYTYIMRNFFASIPDSLYWSSRVDGCSNWKYLWKVMVPIGRPSLVTVILLNALASWNSFMWPLLVIKTTPKRTLPFGLYAFTTEAGQAQELIMAASTVVVLPMIVLFLFARKQILRGVARGGIKG